MFTFMKSGPTAELDSMGTSRVSRIGRARLTSSKSYQIGDFDATEFKSDSFGVLDLIHPDDVVTNPKTEGVLSEYLREVLLEHTIRPAFKRMALDSGNENTLWNQEISEGV
jgi:hypothetical protein